MTRDDFTTEGEFEGRLYHRGKVSRDDFLQRECSRDK
jgi:hypothetical protein